MRNWLRTTTMWEYGRQCQGAAGHPEGTGKMGRAITSHPHCSEPKAGLCCCCSCGCCCDGGMGMGLGLSLGLVE